MNATTIAPNLPTADAREAEVQKEMSSAGRALFSAAFTVVVGSFIAAILISLLHFSF